MGQSTVLYEGNGASIILSRGVSTGAFAVGADERRLLVSLQLLGTTTYFYPPGSGLAEPRIPFRYPTASAPQEPCNRYELIGGGAYQNFGGNASEPILIATAERFHPTQPASGAPTTTTELVAPPSTTSTTTAVGPASDPVASPFDQCPSPPPLSFDANASQNAIATVRAAVPRIYTNINTAGYQITSAEPAGASGFGSIPAGMCGALVGERTYVVELSFPAMAPSASLSQGQLFVSRFPQGWQVWERYH